MGFTAKLASIEFAAAWDIQNLIIYLMLDYAFIWFKKNLVVQSIHVLTKKLSRCGLVNTVARETA